jgi:hypothetical protein
MLIFWGFLRFSAKQFRTTLLTVAFSSVLISCQVTSVTVTSPAPEGSSDATLSNSNVTPSPTPTGLLTYSVQISWNPNHEKAVNSPGGGYRVSYSKSPGFSLSSAESVNVPYVSGANTPVTTALSGLSAGTYYIKITAYSALTPPGSSTQASSNASSEVSITVP